MKLLVDMNLSPHWIEFLAEAGFEATHWSAIGTGLESDAELMVWAASHDYVVLTSDLDFGAILAATHRSRPSVVQIRGGRLSPAKIGSAVVAAVQQTRRELAEGALVSVDVVRARVRILPLKV